MININELRLKKDAATCRRRTWENHWQDVRDYVHPFSEIVTGQSVPGERMSNKLYDGTAPWANEQLASGLQSFLTSPTERWFNVEIEGYDFMSDSEALEWLEIVTDTILNVYGKSHSNFYDSFHEAYLDLGAYGTAVVNQEWSSDNRCPVFRSIPVPDIFIAESENGMVDTVFRTVLMTSRQISQKWPDHTCKAVLDDKTQEKTYTVWHGVFPRTDRDIKKLNQTNKKFASVWWIEEGDMHVLKESGFDSFPYHVPRWMKRSGEVYGRSPAMVCLPDIKMVNVMEKYQIRSIQKIVDPPLMVPNDGFMLPLDVTPGGVNWYEQGIGSDNMIFPLRTEGRPEFGEEKLEQKRQHILRTFYADWIIRNKKRERQTAVEIMDDRTEMLQLMSPILSRLMTELLGPTIERTYDLLRQHNAFPPAPASIGGARLRIGYVSPAAKAQGAIKGTQMSRYVQEIIPLSQVDPSILDIINLDEYARQMSVTRDVSRKIIRSPEEVETKRQGRQQMEQAAQMAEIAKPASEAIKNVAQANAQVPTQQALSPV